MEEPVISRTAPRRRALAAALAAGLLATGAWMWSSSNAAAEERTGKNGKGSAQHDGHKCPGRDGGSEEISV
ncbi:MAG: hypothetical protein M3Q75_15225 [Gemmatimonadota bacterium]|nr:hypothetical protein [Gemmatimonadota bacterium]